MGEEKADGIWKEKKIEDANSKGEKKVNETGRRKSRRQWKCNMQKKSRRLWTKEKKDENERGQSKQQWKNEKETIMNEEKAKGNGREKIRWKLNGEKPAKM